MKSPTRITIDPEYPVAYVAYRDIAPGETARTDRVSFDVRADYNDAGDLLGIELLSLGQSAVDEGRAYAQKLGYAFPVDLAAGNLRA
jgi:hypothetical protein